MSKMKTPLSPSDIEVLIHHYVFATVHPRENSPAVQEAIRMFLGCGMMELDPDIAKAEKDWHRFYVTEKGEAFIKKLCNTGELVQKWE